MKAWTLNPPTQSPGDLQHSWEQTKDVGVADALTDNVQQKDKDEEDKEDVDTEEASSLDQTTTDRRKDVDTEGVLTEPGMAGGPPSSSLLRQSTLRPMA